MISDTLADFFCSSVMSRSFTINPVQDGPFLGCSRMTRSLGQKGPPPLKSVTHILQWCNLAVIPYLKKIQKTKESREIPLEICWHQEIHIQITFWDIISIFFNFFELIKIVLINMVPTLMMSAKMATLGLLKIKVFWNKLYYVITSVSDFNTKILSHDSNYKEDMVMWPKFDDSNISISPENMQKLCFSTIFPHQEVRWTYGIFCSVRSRF